MQVEVEAHEAEAEAQMDPVAAVAPLVDRAPPLRPAAGPLQAAMRVLSPPPAFPVPSPHPLGLQHRDLLLSGRGGGDADYGDKDGDVHRQGVL